MTARLDAAFARLLRSRKASSAAADPEERRSALRIRAEGAALLEWIDAGEGRQSELVRLADRSENGIGFRSKHKLAEGTAVLLTSSGDGAVKGVVRRSLRDAEGGFRHGVRIIRDERRRHDRIPLDELALVNAVGGSVCELRVRIRDASESGLQLASPTEIAVGAPVRIEFQGWERAGVAMHVAPHDGLFLVGVQFVGPPEQIRQRE